MKKIFYILTLNTLALSLAYADSVYEYTDKNGNLIFTNKPIKNSKKVDLPPISVYSSPMTNSYSNRNNINKSNIKNSNVQTIYPKNMITNSYSNKGTNETGRKQILSDELASEKLALVDSQQALSEAKKIKLASEKTNNNEYQNRIQALQDSVTEHQKNIDILSKQLGVN